MLVRVFKTIGFFFWLHVLFQKESLVFRTISPRLLVTENEVLIHVGYSKSYKNKQRHEIQSAYFGHTRFSIFTASCYLCDAEKKII